MAQLVDGLLDQAGEEAVGGRGEAVEGVVEALGGDDGAAAVELGLAEDEVRTGMKRSTPASPATPRMRSAPLASPRRWARGRSAARAPQKGHQAQPHPVRGRTSGQRRRAGDARSPRLRPRPPVRARQLRPPPPPPPDTRRGRRPRRPPGRHDPAHRASPAATPAGRPSP